ncbi:sensor histidine kinase [Aquabacterium sp. OR-4]|uniref:sensor histidine kinase n=1 Tax=Aquabacterium sp. OR-4 TaxID=2978127 RepID=UPI0021B16D94|nr:HAMP domain-containing sensor histidine kinase [Aquabacterium sp. OR-4]MDT7835047.1 HAMP domain-containing sensor histidine kinase [Aquabacterium sp. OR-4]
MAWRNSLGVKVMLAFVVGAALSVLLIVAAASVLVHSSGNVLEGIDVADAARDMSDELRFDARGVPVGLGNGHDDREKDFGLANDFKLDWIFESLRQESAYRVLDASGRVVLLSPAGAAFWPDDPAARRLARTRFEFAHAGVAMRGATEPVWHQGRVWYLQLAVSRRFLHLMYEAFALPFTGASISLFTLVLLLVFGPCVYLTLRYALRPVQQLSEAAADISPRSLHARLAAPQVPREIAPLVDSFNRVLERLERGYRIQQEFLATAAHELKTPLALVRAQIELGPPTEQRELLLRDVAHMSRQVQQLLHLAEASEAQNYRPGEVDVHEVLHEAASYLQRMADAAEVRLELPPRPHPERWRADHGALFTLLKNLLENAVQHTPPGTLVRVELAAGRLSVRDWGPGVSPDELPLLFARFWRGPHRRDLGAGLGLSICHEIAQAHGWQLQASRAEPGLRMVLCAPGMAAGAGTQPRA